MKKTLAKKSLRLDQQTIRRLEDTEVRRAVGGVAAKSVLQNTGSPFSCDKNYGCGYQFGATYFLICH